MGFLGKLFGKQPAADEQAVLIHLDGVGLADDIYENYDVATLEDQLNEALSASPGVGEFDGNEVGPTVTTLYLYGKNSEVLFACVEPVLRKYPLCAGARVEVRAGGPGSPTREVRL